MSLDFRKVAEIHGPIFIWPVLIAVLLEVGEAGIALSVTTRTTQNFKALPLPQTSTAVICKISREEEAVDLGPYGAGYYLCSLNFMSDHFADAMKVNTRFLERHSGCWRFDVHDLLRIKRCGISNYLDLDDLRFLGGLNSVYGGNQSDQNSQ